MRRLKVYRPLFMFGTIACIGVGETEGDWFRVANYDPETDAELAAEDAALADAAAVLADASEGRLPRYRSPPPPPLLAGPVSDAAAAAASGRSLGDALRGNASTASLISGSSVIYFERNRETGACEYVKLELADLPSATPGALSYRHAELELHDFVGLARVHAATFPAVAAKLRFGEREHSFLVPTEISTDLALLLDWQLLAVWA